MVLSGHVHNYERFAPQDPAGLADPTRGIREFVVGTGGNDTLYGFNAPIANSQVRDSATYGVLKLTLHATSYDWQFVPAGTGTFTDTGTGTCVTPVVGGIARLPEAVAAEAPLGAKDGSAVNPGTLAVIAGAAVIGALALGGGVWWARRRIG